MQKIIVLSLTIFLSSQSFLLCSQEPAVNQLSQEALTLTVEHKQALGKRLEQFTQQHCALLAPEELQYLTNLIYLTYCLASLDVHVRDRAQEILFAAQATQHALITYTHAGAVKDALVKNLNTIDAAVNAQINHLNAWQHCCNVEDILPPDSALLKAIENFKSIIELEIGCWVDDHSEFFDKKLKESSDSLITIGDSVVSIGHTYNTLKENRAHLPSVPENKNVAKIGVASRTAHGLHTLSWRALAIAQQMNNAEGALQELSVALVYLYYQAAYAHLSQYDTRFRTIMYNAHGLIPAEQRTQELPHIAEQQ